MWRDESSRKRASGKDVRRVVFDIFLSKYNLPLFPDFSNRLLEKSLKN